MSIELVRPANTVRDPASPGSPILMRLSGAVLLLLVLGILWTNPAYAQDEDDDDDGVGEFVNGEVIVKIDPRSGATIGQINTQYGFAPKFDPAPKLGNLHQN